MQPKILKLVNDIRSSYWFIPAVMASAAIAMGTGVLYVDARIGADWLTELGWYQSNTSDGAREVLSTIAGSAITVAGVVFSITIVSVSFAAGQYGPRVLSNFMRDRGNQITLGTFIATFLYCIIVMRTIRGGDDDGFVPDFAVLIALLLALCSIAVLIYFIHHVPRSIHANSVVARIGRQLIDAFDEVYPEFIGEGKPEASSDSLRVPPALSHREAQRPIDLGQARAIRSPCTGYIEAIDDDALMEIARKHDLIVRLECRPGEFIHEGRVFAHSAPPAKADDKAMAEIADAFVVASQRTPLQDTSFLIDELVEVGTPRAFAQRQPSLHRHRLPRLAGRGAFRTGAAQHPEPAARRHGRCLARDRAAARLRGLSAARLRAVPAISGRGSQCGDPRPAHPVADRVGHGRPCAHRLAARRGPRAC